MATAVVLSHTWIAHELGNLEPWLDDNGFDIRRATREDGPDFAGADLLIVMGSPWSVAQGECSPAGQREIDAVREYVAQGRPMLGICYGAQVLATALGGQVRRQQPAFVGYVEIEAQIDAAAGPWLTWHNDAITAPASASVIGRLPHADLAFAQDRAWGLQPHIEVDADILERMAIALHATPDVYDSLVESLTLDGEGHRVRARSLLDHFGATALG